MLARLASYLRVTAGVAALLSNSAAWAEQLPTGGSVAAGNATIVQPNSNTLNINQSTNQAIINWNSFSVGRGGSVNFNQPNSSSATLNRVLGSTPSWIAGAINAPGTVLLVNPNGIAITKSGVINTGSFAASTLDISNADFMAGNYKFTGNGGSAGVRNAGRINVSDGGFAALLGGQVSNSGIISARLGRVGLGAGELITLDFAGDGFLSVAVPSNQIGKLVNASGALVTNSGKIRANGGQVFLSAATASNILRDAVNVPGSIRANSVGMRGGKIVIGGGAGGKVNVTGRLAANGGRKHKGGSIAVSGASVNLAGKVTAKGTSGGAITVASAGDLSVSGKVTAKGGDGKGGRIELTGANVKVLGALIDASGATGGGTVLIGGDYQGKNPAIQNATTTYVGTDVVLKADATQSGDGGKIIVWSDNTTTFAGETSARGGAQGGDGGFIEISGKGTLNYTGFADLMAAHGLTGTLLLDPSDIIIDGGANDTTLAGGTFTGNSNTSHLNVAVLNSALDAANVIVDASGGSAAGSGTITVNSAVIGANNHDLTLMAIGDIMLSGGINVGTGTLALVTTGSVSTVSQPSGRITAGSVSLNLAGGGQVFMENSANSIASISGSAHDVFVFSGRSLTTGSLTVGGFLRLDTFGASSDIVVSGAVTALQSISMTAAGDLTVGQSISRTGTGTGTIRFNATGDIVVNGGVSIGQTANLGAGAKANIVFNADSDANGAGRINLNGASGNLVTMSTNGGNITLGGRDNTLSGTVTGVATGDASSAEGVRMNFASLTAGGGALAIYGHGGSVSASGSNNGVFIDNSTISADGGIAITGTGGSLGGASNNAGVFISNGSVTANSGDVNIVGVGGSTNGIANDGVVVASEQITTNGTANITINGSGSTTGNNNLGVFLSSTTIRSTSAAAGAGTVSISGTLSSGAATQGNRGVLMQSGTTVSSVAGDITLSGTGGGTGGNDEGIYFGGGIVQSAGGALITLNGTGGASNAVGINLTASGGSNAVKNTAGLGQITLNADDITLASVNVSVSAPGQTVTLRPLTAGRTIDLGGAGGSSLGLSSAEINTITAGTLVIGDTTAGNITVSGAIAPTGATTLVLRTGQAISQTAGSIVETNLGLVAGTGVTMTNAGNDVTNLSGLVTGTGNFVYTDTNTFSVVNLAAVGHAASTTGIQTANGSITLQGTQVNLGANLLSNGTGGAASAVSITGPVVLTTDVTIDTDAVADASGGGNVTLSSTVDASGLSKLTVDARAQGGGTGGDITFGGAVGAGSRIQELAILGNGVTFTGTNNVDTLAVVLSGAGNGLSYTNADRLSVRTAGGIDGVVTNSGTVSITAGGTLDVSRNVNTTGTGNTTLTTTGFNGNNIQANGQVGNSNGTTMVISAGNITTGGTIDGRSVGLSAQTGIGSRVGSEVQIIAGTNLAANSAAGGVFVRTFSGPTLTTVNGVTNGAGAGGQYYVRVAGGGFKVGAAVNTGGTGATTIVQDAGNILLNAAVGNGNADTVLTSNGTITGTGVVTGANVTLDSKSGVGTSGARVNTTATTLAARSATSGGVFVNETDAVTLNAIGGVANSAAGGGAYDVTAAGSVTVTGTVNSSGTGTTTLASTAGAVIAVNNTVGNSSGAAVLTSNGAINGTGTVTGTNVTLDSALGIGAGTGGRLATSAGTLAARSRISGGVFVSEANAVTLSTIGSVANGAAGGGAAFDLTASGAITVSGAVNTPGTGVTTLTTSSGDIALGARVGNTSAATSLISAGNITGSGLLQGTTVTLDSATGVGTGTGGRVNTSAGTLSARSSTSGGVFVNETDAVTLSGNNYATGDNTYDLTAGGTITVSGSVGATGGIVIDTTGALAINAALNAGGGNITLITGGAISQNASGVITANTLALSTTNGNVALATATNAITNLGTTTLGAGSLNLLDAGGLTVTGAVTATGGVTLNTSGVLAINSRLNAGTSNVALTGTQITQANTGAGITASGLSAVTTAGDITLAPTGTAAFDFNTVSTFAANAGGSGNVSFKNSTGFDIGTVGSVSGIGSQFSGFGASILSLETTNGSISQSQDIAVVGLNVKTAGGDATLNRTAGNRVEFIDSVDVGAGAFTYFGNAGISLSINIVKANAATIALNPGFDMNVGGSITVGNGGLNLSARSLSVSGTITSGADAFLEGQDISTAAGSSISAATVHLLADNMTIINQINALGGTIYLAPVTAGRQVSLGNNVVGGLVIDNNALSQMSSAATLVIGKGSAGGIVTAGAIQIGYALVDNARLDLFTAGGISLINALGMTVGGGTGALNISAGGTVNLTVSVFGGVAVGTVTGSTTSGDFLVNGGNGSLAVGSAGITTAGGEIVVANFFGNLSVGGALTSNGGNIFAGASSLLGPGAALTIAADINAGAGSIGLVAAEGGITQTGGVLIGANLLALSGGGIALAFGTLPGTANQISGNVILNAGATGDINFTNASGFQLGGFSGITYASLGQTLTPDPVANAALSTTGTATLTAGGDITQANGPADKVLAGTLVVAGLGGTDINVTLDTFDNVGGTFINKVTNLGTVNIGQGVFTLYNNSDLTVTGAATAGGYDVASDGNLTQNAGANINTSNTNGDIFLTAGCSCGGSSLTLNANLNSGTGTVFLAGDSVTQPAGAITARTVNVQAITGASLNSTTNNFAVMNGLSDGDFSATTSRSLRIGSFGVTSDNGSISLTALGTTSDITVPAGTSVGGFNAIDVTFNAGRDVVVDGAVFVTGTASVTAGRDIQVAGCGCGGIVGNDVSLNASRD
ncbi:MAG: filamentous hemagglutinin outer membrane protein, partial [Bradyrhizobium sp.]|nr:filamentous hemagglutinin outer membrane protein [Bradyrhizobium sp.]